MSRLYFLIVIFLLMNISCTGDVNSNIIGEWECLRLKQVLQINGDGTVQLTDTKTGYAQYDGTYSIESENITFNFPRFSRPVSRRIKSINSEELVLLDSNGIEEIYVKR